MESGGWRVESGEWRVESGGRMGSSVSNNTNHIPVLIIFDSLIDSSIYPSTVANIIGVTTIHNIFSITIRNITCADSGWFANTFLE